MNYPEIFSNLTHPTFDKGKNERKQDCHLHLPRVLPPCLFQVFLQHNSLPKPLHYQNAASLTYTLVFLVTAFIKCKLRRVVSHEKLFEQGLNNFTDSIGAADVKGNHAAIRQVESSFVIAVSTAALALGGLHSDRSAEFHLNFDKASVNPIHVLQQEERIKMLKLVMTSFDISGVGRLKWSWQTQVTGQCKMSCKKDTVSKIQTFIISGIPAEY